MPGLTNETAVGFANLDYILPVAIETVGTFSFDETSAAQQTLITVSLSERTIINAFWLDMSNCNRDVTFRLFSEIDGSNMREFQQNEWLTTFDDGVLISGFVMNDDVRLTLQCDGAGAGSVDIPYTVL